MLCAKALVWRAGSSLPGVSALSAAESMSMVQLHSVTEGECDMASNVCSSSSAPALPMGEQLLRDTSLERVRPLDAHTHRFRPSPAPSRVHALGGLNGWLTD